MSIWPYIPQLSVAWAAYFIAVASPGPAVMALVTTSVRSGRGNGMAMAMGIMTASIFWATSAALGLSALITAYGQALTLFKIVGGLYLFYLGCKALKSALSKAPDIADDGARKPETLGTSYLRGLMIHLTNPKAIFVWIAMVSLGLPHGAPGYVTPVFIGGCFIIGALIMNTFALVFSLKPVLAAYEKSRRGIEGAMAAFFGLAAFKLVTAQI